MVKQTGGKISTLRGCPDQRPALRLDLCGELPRFVKHTESVDAIGHHFDGDPDCGSGEGIHGPFIHTKMPMRRTSGAVGKESAVDPDPISISRRQPQSEADFLRQVRLGRKTDAGISPVPKSRGPNGCGCEKRCGHHELRVEHQSRPRRLARIAGPRRGARRKCRGGNEATDIFRLINPRHRRRHGRICTPRGNFAPVRLRTWHGGPRL